MPHPIHLSTPVGHIDRGWPAVCAAAAAETTVPNGSFEQAGDRGPEAWRPQTWGGRGEFEYASEGHTGDHSVSLRSEQGADISWTVRVPVEPFARYRLSGWIKTQDVAAGSGRGALFNLHNIQGVATPAVTGTSDWTRVEVEFETDANDVLQVNCLFGGWGLATGQAWFDDVSLEQIGRSAPAELKIVVHAAQTGEPISKYIYGQFIEHLGRCIYGGIWAEMLEDRKFCFPITAEYQPYRAPAEHLVSGRRRFALGDHRLGGQRDDGHRRLLRG